MLWFVFEHFTDGARRVLVLASEEAQQSHAVFIEPDHLLLAMLRVEEGIAANALSGVGVDDARVRDLIGDANGRESGSESGRQDLAPAAMRIIERAVRMSWAQADGGVDTEHLLLALLDEQDETTESVLAALDVTPEEVVQRVDALMVERASGTAQALTNRPLDS
jgi:ATP-dependent Clp protease ATP-binding subunit ClpC